VRLIAVLRRIDNLGAPAESRYTLNPIRFEHIPEVGLEKQHTFSKEKLSEMLFEEGRELYYKAVEPSVVLFRLERKNRDVTVTGSGHFTLVHPCVRCLENVSISMKLEFGTELEKPDEIDLQELLREELFLELPLYPACEPSCP
jgi:uncharacterized metal-binding protein YceD (DUF177 family)